jgi:hypothetical protein
MRIRLPFLRPRQRFLRGVHYFGHAHPASFWDAACFADAPDHLARIRSDGFDAVILVVPWRGFQHTLQPPSYDELNIQRLQTIMGMVEDAGLRAILRVSFPWNSDPHSVASADERVLGLFTDDAIRKAWQHYLVRLRGIAERFRCFEFPFFSWEDVPATREHMPHRPLQERLRLAEAMGYRRFLSERFDLERIGKLFGRHFASIDEVFIPVGDCEAYATYIEFVNRALRDLLDCGRMAWPSLAMQLRVDFDGMKVDDRWMWIENDIRLDDPSLRVTYWFPSMYSETRGQTISADQALDSLRRMLDRVTGAGRNTNHFLDQFVFHDESPHFSHLPRIAESEMGRFLEEAAKLLRLGSRGYALWSYFDYRVNHFYNPIFLRGLDGWHTEGTVVVDAPESPEANRFAMLAPGASIMQRIDPHLRGYGPGHYKHVEFAALAKTENGEGRVALVTNGVTEAELGIHAGDACTIHLQLPAERHREGESDVAIKNIGSTAIALTDLALWGAVYRSHVYDELGEPGRYLELVRAMNRISASTR